MGKLRVMPANGAIFRDVAVLGKGRLMDRKVRVAKETHEEMQVSRRLTKVFRRQIGMRSHSYNARPDPMKSMPCDEGAWVDIRLVLMNKTFGSSCQTYLALILRQAYLISTILQSHPHMKLEEHASIP